MNNPLHFRSYFKFLGRNRLYTAINVLGLSVSLMFVILIAVYTTQELSVDSFHKNADRIYVLGHEHDTATGYGIVPYLLSRYPEIEKATAFTNNHVVVDIEGIPYVAEVGMVDSTFFDIFSFKMIEGDASALYTTTEALVSESFARKAFPLQDPIGKIIDLGTDNLDGEQKVVVAGIIEDFKHSIIPESDIVLSAQFAEHFNGSISNKNMNNAGTVMLFLMTYEGADLQSKTDDMAEYFKEFFWTYRDGRSKEVILTPLRDIYFHMRGGGNFWINTGDIMLVRILVSVGILILLFALINYINLTVAQTGFRAKEMATRRLLGASRSEIFLKFMAESTLMCALAFMVGLLLAGAFEGVFGKILYADIDVFGSIGWQSALIYILTILVLGVVSGVIPAVFISRYRSIDVVKGSFAHRSKMVFSKVFIVFQNVITITLIAAALTMLLQIRHMINMPLGYNTENILEVPGMPTQAQLHTFRNEISNLASVKRVSLTQGYPLNGGNNNSFMYDGQPVSMFLFEVDTVFMDMMGFEIIKDNGQEEAGRQWFNETVVGIYGMTPDSTAYRWQNIMVPFAGIVKDFRLHNAMYDRTPPVMITIHRNLDDFWPWQLLIEVQGDQAKAYHEIAAIYKEIAGFDMQQAGYLTDKIRESYAAQRRVFNIVLIFTIVAVLISMLGLLAMSTYFVQQKAGGIAVRKVFGSTRGEVFRMLVLGFMKLVLVAFVISVPVIWYAMTQWLANYPYRIGLSPLIFAAAGLTAVVIAMASVSWQSARAANANPIDAIKS